MAVSWRWMSVIPAQSVWNQQEGAEEEEKSPWGEDATCRSCSKLTDTNLKDKLTGGQNLPYDLPAHLPVSSQIQLKVQIPRVESTNSTIDDGNSAQWTQAQSDGNRVLEFFWVFVFGLFWLVFGF